MLKKSFFFSISISLPQFFICCLIFYYILCWLSSISLSLPRSNLYSSLPFSVPLGTTAVPACRALDHQHLPCTLSSGFSSQISERHWQEVQKGKKCKIESLVLYLPLCFFPASWPSSSTKDHTPCQGAFHLQLPLVPFQAQGARSFPLLLSPGTVPPLSLFLKCIHIIKNSAFIKICLVNQFVMFSFKSLIGEGLIYFKLYLCTFICNGLIFCKKIKWTSLNILFYTFCDYSCMSDTWKYIFRVGSYRNSLQKETPTYFCPKVIESIYFPLHYNHWIL